MRDWIGPLRIVQKAHGGRLKTGPQDAILPHWRCRLFAVCRIGLIQMQVLVVEDEPKMAGLLRQGLAEEGHTVTVAATGLEALNLALGYPFDGMLLHVMLPGPDG